MYHHFYPSNPFNYPHKHRWTDQRQFGVLLNSMLLMRKVANRLMVQMTAHWICLMQIWT